MNEMRKLMEAVKPLYESNGQVFSTDTTEMPLYDDLLKAMRGELHVDVNYFIEEKGLSPELAHMTPEEYIADCAKGFDVSYESLYSQREKTSDGEGGTLVDKYVEMMKSGTTFPMPVIEYRLNGWIRQEGLHRAIAAHKLGIEKIPVLKVHEVN